MTGSRRLVGTVVSFDEAAGLGDIEVEGPEGGGGGDSGVGGSGAVGESVGAGGVGGAGAGAAARYMFHCTQIADGSRTVAVGTRVSFGLLAGRIGRWEAADVQAAGE